MDNKQDLQTLQDALQHHSEEVRSLQNTIKRSLASKKESDTKQQDQALHSQLDAFNNDVQKLQDRVNSVITDRQSDSSEERQQKQPDRKDNRKQNDPKRLTSPEDQENAYQLKATMMPQIYSQSKVLQAELMLYNRRNELRNQRKDRQVSYNRETNLSVATTLHIIKMYERRAKEAESRVEALEAELEGRNGTRQTSGPIRPEKSQGHPPPVKADELSKKNQVLIEESQDQKREIQRLKKENADLFLKVKQSTQERDLIMNQLSTSEMARKDLYTRFQRQKAQHDRLSKSLTRQSADWIEARKQRDQAEEEFRWRQVGHAAPHGAQSRTFYHPVPRNVDQPRNMYPVTAYADPSPA
ncbi:kelch-like protein 29 [Plakobranchus ocellatus]|uniref:Kelch-like protein 29 n=1 Tax=Plakobranchus ocellatus TaxID=259542 RepID=A0AAV3ZS60_9GAST|nr:kelch-like protein 29 [Plakobranchus ocellatus]